MTPGFVDPRDNSESKHDFRVFPNAPLNNKQDFLILIRNTQRKWF